MLQIEIEPTTQTVHTIMGIFQSILTTNRNFQEEERKKCLMRYSCTLDLDRLGNPFSIPYYAAHILRDTHSIQIALDSERNGTEKKTKRFSHSIKISHKQKEKQNESCLNVKLLRCISCCFFLY